MVWLSLSPCPTHGSDSRSNRRHVQHTQWDALKGGGDETIFRAPPLSLSVSLSLLPSLSPSPSPYIFSLTLAVIRDVHHCTLATDAEHWVGILDVAHKQLVVVEHPGRAVNHLGGTDEPGTSDPWITTEERESVIKHGR